MLVVEIDGNVHVSPAVMIKDSRRDDYLRAMGYTVLRYPNQLVLEQTKFFLNHLAAQLPATGPSPSGRGGGEGAQHGRGGGEGNTPSPNGIGVFWHTQGSGKSYSMLFFSQKILRRHAGNWTFVVVTDRIELDDQIAKTSKPPVL